MKKTMKPSLTRRQNDALNFIKRHIANKGYSPTIREIAEGIDLSSSSTVHHMLQQIAEKGFINHVPGQPRSIRIIEQLADPRDQMITDLMEALEWYAGEQYGSVQFFPPIPDIPILHDCGEKARSTLEEIRKRGIPNEQISTES